MLISKALSAFKIVVDRIAFLYKIKDCAPDCEIRLVKYKDSLSVNMDSGYLEHGRSPKLYIPIPIINSVESIILGSCVPKPSQLVQFLYKCGLTNIKMSSTYMG